MLTVRVDGVDRVLNLLGGLGEIDKNNVVRDGLRSVGEMFKSAGQQNLHGRLLGELATRGLYRSGGKTPGNLMDSIIVRVKKRRLGVLTGFTVKGSHAHLVDSGTGERFYKGMSRGIMPANTFWHDTMTQNEGKASDMLYNAVKRSIDRIQSRL